MTILILLSWRYRCHGDTPVYLCVGYDAVSQLKISQHLLFYWWWKCINLLAENPCVNLLTEDLCYCVNSQLVVPMVISQALCNYNDQWSYYHSDEDVSLSLPLSMYIISPSSEFNVKVLSLSEKSDSPRLSPWLPHSADLWLLTSSTCSSDPKTKINENGLEKN